MRRTRLRPISDKRRAEQVERKRAAWEAYGPKPACRGQGTIPTCPRRDHDADDGHEMFSRARGGSITDMNNVVPLCRDGHTWVTEHPAEAARLVGTDGRLLLRSRNR